MNWSGIRFYCAGLLKRCLPPGLRMSVLRWLGRVPYPEISMAELAAWAGEHEQPIPAQGPVIYPELDLRVQRELESPEFTEEDDVMLRLNAAGSTRPRLSVIVVTYNNLPLTRLCLRSIAQNTDDCELVVVDNASDDCSRDWLNRLSRKNPGIKLVLNRENRGFAGANNQGLEIAGGEILVLLNNDTMVPAGWIQAMEPFLQDPAVGLVGPCTNRAANQARVGVPYSTYQEMQAYAAWRGGRFAGQTRDLPMLAMFCLAMRRDVYERAGCLDERFGIGMFEDDDYSRRVRNLGLRIVLAQGAFVHHFQMAAFGRLKVTGEYRELFERNRRLFLEKWGSRADAGSGSNAS